ncbi:MAG: hypothetical protein RSB96_04095, partial [Oscillospiraceae bacterium]
YNQGYFTPDMVNSVLKQINVNPTEPTESALNRALGQPNDNEDKLVAYSEWYNINNMMYKRTNSYLGNMLAFDLTLHCYNAHGSDYKSAEFKEELNRVYRILDKLHYKREFKKIVNNMLRQETVFTSFRDDSSDDYALQQLPSEFCKITGHTGKTLLFDYDMYYFLKPSVDINLYSPVFKKYFQEVFNDPDNNNYIPSNPLNARNGEFVMWHQTSPDDNFWAWKFSPEIFTKIPYLAPMMKDSLQSSIVRQLQINKNLATAGALIMGEIGFLDPKSGAKADQLNLSPISLSTFMNLVKDGLDDVWKLGGLPLENLKKFQFEDKNPNMYENYLKTLSGQSVSMSRAIYTNDKMSYEEATTALQTDGNLMQALYAQFEDFLEFYINKKTRKYKFQFKFTGLNYDSDREARLQRLLDVADRGIILGGSIGATLGLTPQEFSRELEEYQNNGFSDKLTSLLSIHTASGESKGRPIKKRGIKGDSRDYDE